jgi:hypothetical protein
MPAMTDLPMDDGDRKRRIRRSAWLLAGFAMVVYVGFIIAYVNRGG